MAIDLAGPIPKLISVALDAATLRQEVISSNIANISTVGYHPMRVSFEDQFSSALSKASLADDSALTAQLESISPRVYESNMESQVNQLDIEMINMAKNTIHYQTLLTGISGYMSILKLAIKEGKV